MLALHDQPAWTYPVVCSTVTFLAPMLTVCGALSSVPLDAS
jgi:hypothetical protein